MIAADGYHRGMRRCIALALLCGCALVKQPPAPQPVQPPKEPFGLSIEEEAQILRLEDRREFNPEIVSDWLHRTNPTHRARMALALARIGPHAFVDANNN